MTIEDQKANPVEAPTDYHKNDTFPRQEEAEHDELASISIRVAKLEAVLSLLLDSEETAKKSAD
jgi:hypothetical protein